CERIVCAGQEQYIVLIPVDTFKRLRDHLALLVLALAKLYGAGQVGYSYGINLFAEHAEGVLINSRTYCRGRCTQQYALGAVFKIRHRWPDHLDDIAGLEPECVKE